MRTEIRLAERLNQINPSSTLAITSKAKKLKIEGKDIVNFAAGEPDFDTPEFIKDEAISAIKSGFTKYTPTTGIPELKKLISEKFKKDNFLDYAPEQIVVSCGAKHSIFNALFVLVNPGDEVLIPLPYWVSYPEMVNLVGGNDEILFDGGSLAMDCQGKTIARCKVFEEDLVFVDLKEMSGDVHDWPVRAEAIVVLEIFPLASIISLTFSSLILPAGATNPSATSWLL